MLCTVIMKWKNMCTNISAPQDYTIIEQKNNRYFTFQIFLFFCTYNLLESIIVALLFIYGLELDIILYSNNYMLHICYINGNWNPIITPLRCLEFSDYCLFNVKIIDLGNIEVQFSHTDFTCMSLHVLCTGKWSHHQDCISVPAAK